MWLPYHSLLSYRGLPTAPAAAGTAGSSLTDTLQEQSESDDISTFAFVSLSEVCFAS